MGADDLASQLVDLDTAQIGVVGGEGFGETIVLSHEQRVHGNEADLLVDAQVARHEQGRTVAAAFVLEAPGVVGQQRAVA